ncbi:MAG: hypothetical protein ACYSN7_06650, partial [Planctomycetota bacterium]|jgi:indolepyruvate ferredoxin oxidoreductase alpha subunit
MHSSQNEQDTRWVGIYGKLPILEPSGPAEAREFVAEAFKISEKFDTPVIVRMTTRISHTKEDVKLDKRIKVKPVKLEPDMRKYVMVPGNARLRHVFVEKRIEKLQRFSERTKLNKIEIKDTKLGSGCVLFEAWIFVSVLRRKNQGVFQIREEAGGR